MIREILASAAKVSAIEANTIDVLGGGTLAIHNLANGSSAGDAVNKSQLDLKIDSSLIGANSGVASLDSGGKIPLAQLPASLMEYQGVWNASTNSPALADGSGTAGFFYRVNVAGTQDLGSGPQTFVVGDWVMYDGSIWQLAHAGSDIVISVNGQAGVVVLDAGDIGYDNSTSGFTATDVQGAIDEIAASFLPLAGGEMTGSIDMGTFAITDMADPTNPQDAATKHYVDSAIAAGVVVDDNAIQNLDGVISLVLDGSTLSASGDGLKVADGGLSDTQIASDAAIALSKLASLSTNFALVSNGSGVIVVSGTTATELGYLSGVTSAIQTQLNGKLNLSGGTMTGAIAMGSHKITGLSAGSTSGDAVNFDQVMLLSGVNAMGAAMDMGSHQIHNVSDPSSAQDAMTLNYADTTYLAISDAASTYLPLAGGSMTGTLHMVGASIDLGGSGLSNVSAITDPSNLSSVDAANRRLVYTDGTTVMLDWSGAGVLDAKTNLISNVADPASAQDAATKAYVDSKEATAPVWKKYTFAYSALAAAALTNSITLFSLAAKQVIHGVVVKHSTAFAGGSISAYEVSVGVLGDLEKYSSDFDVFQAVGSSTAQASQDLSPEDFSSAKNILLSAVSVGDNLDQATAGSVDVWVSVATLP